MYREIYFVNILLLLVLLFSNSIVFARYQPSQKIITGSVIDESGGLLINAKVLEKWKVNSVLTKALSKNTITVSSNNPTLVFSNCANISQKIKETRKTEQ